MDGDDGYVEVPIFSGEEDPQGWIAWVEAYFIAHGFTEENKIAFAYGFIEEMLVPRGVDTHLVGSVFEEQRSHKEHVALNLANSDKEDHAHQIFKVKKQKHYKSTKIKHMRKKNIKVVVINKNCLCEMIRMMKLLSLLVNKKRMTMMIMPFVGEIQNFVCKTDGEQVIKKQVMTTIFGHLLRLFRKTHIIKERLLVSERLKKEGRKESPGKHLWSCTLDMSISNTHLENKLLNTMRLGLERIQTTQHNKQQQRHEDTVKRESEPTGQTSERRQPFSGEEFRSVKKKKSVDGSVRINESPIHEEKEEEVEKQGISDRRALRSEYLALINKISTSFFEMEGSRLGPMDTELKERKKGGDHLHRPWRMCLLCLSFLAKDGRVEIIVDKNGSLFALPINAPAANVVMSGEVVYNHFVLRFDFPDWKLMSEMVPMGEELMPLRETSIASSSCHSASADFVHDSQTTPIRKLSRNRGLVVQEEYS
ncbi:unnamed protein product [Cochlearia groenlandica]